MTDLLARIRALADSSDPTRPLDGLAELLSELATEPDAGRLARAGRLLAEIPAGRLPGRPMRVAVVGTFTADHVGPLLRCASPCCVAGSRPTCSSPASTSSPRSSPT